MTALASPGSTRCASTAVRSGLHSAAAPDACRRSRTAAHEQGPAWLCQDPAAARAEPARCGDARSSAHRRPRADGVTPVPGRMRAAWYERCGAPEAVLIREPCHPARGPERRARSRQSRAKPRPLMPRCWSRQARQMADADAAEAPSRNQSERRVRSAAPRRRPSFVRRHRMSSAVIAHSFATRCATSRA